MSAHDPKRTFSALFDHLVGAYDKRCRHGKAERFRGLEIECSFVLDGHQHWLGTPQDDAGRRYTSTKSMPYDMTPHSVT
jgi:hypothetical protein